MRSVRTSGSDNPIVFDGALCSHPDTPCPAIRRIQVQARRHTTRLELRYRIEGNLEQILVPPELPPQRADKLWQHTCFEAFLRDAEATGYVELNFAPSSEWAMYQFSRYRTGMSNVEAPPPHVCVHRGNSELQLDAVVDLVTLPWLVHAQLKLALCAVIEEADHRMSYWALAHPAGKPDFHHADGFVVTIR